jgi:hypothetical protein
MDRVRQVQQSATNEPVKARCPVRGGDPDRRQSDTPPPGWGAETGSGYGPSPYRVEF